MIIVLTVQEYFLTDRTLFYESFAFVEVNSALIIGPHAQIDLLDDFVFPRPIN